MSNFDMNFANFSITSLLSDITSLQESFEVVDGSILPEAPFVAVIFNPVYPDILSDPYKEIIYAGERVGNTLSSVVRAYESTTQRSHNAGDYVAIIYTAGIFDAIKASLSNVFKEDSLPTGEDGDVRVVDSKVYIKI